jgi:hypothetical protein
MGHAKLQEPVHNCDVHVIWCHQHKLLTHLHTKPGGHQQLVAIISKYNVCDLHTSLQVRRAAVICLMLAIKAGCSAACHRHRSISLEAASAAPLHLKKQTTAVKGTIIRC